MLPCGRGGGSRSSPPCSSWPRWAVLRRSASRAPSASGWSPRTCRSRCSGPPRRGSRSLPRALRVTAPGSPRWSAALAELRRRDRRAGSGTATLEVRHADGDPDDDSYRLTGTADRLQVTCGVRDRGRARRLRPRPGCVGPPTARRTGWARRSRRACRCGWSTSARPGSTPTPTSGAAAPTTRTTRGRSRTSSSPRRRRSTRPRSARRATSVREFAHHVLAQGYNAVTVPGFLEYVTFAEVPEVYADDPEYVDRAEAVRDAFGPIWAELDDLGLDVYLRTDMLVLSTPLEHHLDRRASTSTPPIPGCGTSTRPRSTSSTPSCPQLSGVVLRIGEGGSIYNTPGIDYYSEITVTTVPAVRAMLDAFTGQAERAGKDVVFRTWSVGVGRRRRHAHRTPRRTTRCSPGSTPRGWWCRPSTASATSTPGCRSTTPSSRAPSGASSSCRAGASSSRSAPCPTTSACCTSSRCSASSTPTRTSKASGRGPRTAVRGAPVRCRCC